MNKDSDLYWTVYKYDSNKQKIVESNVFNHSSFQKEVVELLKNEEDKLTFAKKVKSSLTYYFWSKYEYELIIGIEHKKVYLEPYTSENNTNDRLYISPTDNLNWYLLAREHIGKQAFKDQAVIDAFDQIYFQFDKFINYLWRKRND